MLIPTHLVPDQDIELSDLKLTAGPRVNYVYTGGGSHTNSIEITDEYGNDALRDWIIFHSFVTDSRGPINFYIREGFPDRLELLDTPSQFPKDYSKFLAEIYYRDPGAVSRIKDQSYQNLYATYTELSAKKKALIKNYLIDLNHKDGRIDRQILDTSYWQIVKHYALVDRIIGQPPFCTNELNCNTCGAAALKHHKIPARQWSDNRLRAIMGESKWHKTYNEIIGVTREKIRHASVHGARLPSTAMPDHSDIDHVEYDLAKVLDGFETDTHALRALKGMLESVTWYLLMDYLFNHKAFGRPTGYSVSYIRINAPKSPEGEK